MKTNSYFARIVSFGMVAATSLYGVASTPAPVQAAPPADWQQRAQAWVNANVPYNPTVWRDGYRTDCSGFVSYVWRLPESAVTSTMYKYADQVAVNDLQPGDALNNITDHMFVFAGWQDKANGKIYVYDMNSAPNGKVVHKTLTLTSIDANGAKVAEYPNISKTHKFIGQRRAKGPCADICSQPCINSRGLPICFQNGSSNLFFDQNYNRINLTVCASNLRGQLVTAQLTRPGKTFSVVSQIANGTCVTFWDMDGAGPVNRNTTYTTKAALNQNPNQSWPVPCAGATGGQGLCDSLRRN